MFNPTTYKTTRKFALTAMKDFGLGKKSLEERIQNEAVSLATQFQKKAGKSFDPFHDVNCTVSNIICSITMGKRLLFLIYIKHIIN